MADDLPDAVPPSQLTGYATLLESQLRAVIGAVSTAILVAGRPDGRRVMLLLSGGWPYEVFPTRPTTATDQVLRGWDNDALLFPRGLELYQMLTDTANRMSYTLYPGDVPGVRSPEPPAGSYAIHEMWITLQDQGTDLAVAIRDLTSEKTLTGSARVDL